jgi:UDP-glucose 4-epimerase
MKVVVLGGSGFVGSHVAEALSDAGHAVTIVDLKVPSHATTGQRVIQGSILNEELLGKVLEGQDVAYNFAGLADLDEAQAVPVETVRTNVLGNAILLEQARRQGLKRYIFASTVYVSGQAGGFYRASKQACELYVEEYQRWYGLDYTILRYGSIYGRRSDKNNGVRLYLTQALKDRHIIVQGTGDELREYVHATDVARASVQILEPQFRNQVVVITGPQPMRVRDLMEMIREIVGTDIRVEFCPVDPAQRREGRTAHYAVTPYAFRPRLPKKLVSHYYVDMGQGLMDCLEELQDTLGSSAVKVG